MSVLFNSIKMYLSRKGKDDLKKAKSYFNKAEKNNEFTYEDWDVIEELIINEYWQVRWTILRVLKRKLNPRLIVKYAENLPKTSFASMEKAQFLKIIRSIRKPPQQAIELAKSAFISDYWEVRREAVQFLSHFGFEDLWEPFLNSFWKKDRLKERHFEVKMQLPGALTKIKPIQQILPLFSDLLEDSNWKVREKTLLAMYDLFLKEPFPLKNIIRDMDLSCKDLIAKSPLSMTYIEIMKKLGE
ncbi:MAG: HEAT repeat domain-containing protein [Candidatus Coatesbacteria bacterium]|nr:HEAT repeat domain-containing protein [Candidatus Coatesbacteria bacterium]